MKEKSIKLSRYFEVINANYIYLKIKPHVSIRNHNSTNIIKSITHLYRGITQRIKWEERKLWFETPTKVSYMIDITKTSVDFYLICPELYKNIAREKIHEIWSQAEVTEVEGINPFSSEALKYQLYYKKEDALSLAVDRTSNEPLNVILSVIDILKEGNGERVGLFYNFIPTTQKYWKQQYQNTINKINSGLPVNREKFNLKYMSKVSWVYLLDILQMAIDTISEFLGGKPNQNNSEQLSLLSLAVGTIENVKQLPPSTKKKKDATVVNTQIVVLSDSNDKNRKKQYTTSVCQAFNSISEENGNELIYKNLKKSFRYEDYDIGAEKNLCSIDECQNFIQIPGRDLLTQYKIIPQIDVLQTEVPAPLRSGIIRAGENMYRGKPSQVYHTEDKELKNTAICVCGPNRSGKSTLFANMCYDLIKDGRTVIIPDFCGKCKLSDELALVIPKEKIFNIYCHDFEKLQGFGWNEIQPKDDSVFERYRCAKMKSSKLKELINLVNDGDSDLEGRMERYLECAALIVFACKGSVEEVFKILKDHELRHNYIDNIPEDLKDKLSEYVKELLEVDEKATSGTNKGEVIGTKQGHVSAILSRVHRLKENSYIEMMLQKDESNNINLIDEIQQGKLICIRMYDSMFVTQQQKDIYACYWITKVWGALQKRFCDLDEDKLVQTVILVDELYQTKNAERYLTMILSQVPKYRAKFIVSCHHLGQIPVIQEELKSAMCSYMFLRGTNKKAFYAMKEEFEDKGFALEDLLHLKKYQSLNLLAYEDGYWGGITLLPKPVKENK